MRISKFKALVELYMKVVISMKVNTKMIRERVMEDLYGMMEQVIWECGKMDSDTAKEYLHMQMDKLKREYGMMDNYSILQR
jgi:hypothetical protein